MEETATSHVIKDLAVFDFDHTIIDDNADTAVISLIDKKNIPESLKELHRNDGWNAFMQGIFELLHAKGIHKPEITSLIENLKPVSGMLELLRELNKLGNDIIIISDCNSYFIDVWLEKHNIKPLVLRVFTNPAEFDESGLLKIAMYHLQDHCKLSTKNLCKGQILEEFLNGQKANGLIYRKIIYCGDGINDFCPILRLNDADLACVRNNYKCSDLIRKAEQGESFDSSGKPHVVKAELFLWTDANDIIRKISDSASDM